MGVAEGLLIGAIISAVASAGTAVYQQKEQKKLQSQSEEDAKREREKIKDTGAEAESGGIKQLKDAEEEESARATARKGNTKFRIPLESASAVGTQTSTGGTGLKI